LCAIPLYADSVFLNGDVPLGTSTTFSDTNNGITAIFSSSADPGGFTITGSGSLFDPGPANVSNIALDIGFDTSLDSFSADFVLDGPGTFDLSAYSGGLSGTLVGTASESSGSSISFAGGVFDTVVLTSPSTPYFEIANVDVTAGVPEPSYALIFPVLGFGFVMLNRRRAATRN
jgi:hypothetical protein